MKKYWYYVRYSCYNSSGLMHVGMKEISLKKEIDSIYDLNEISARIKLDYSFPLLGAPAVLIDFYSLLRVEDEDSEQ